jgi:hypothetical protein
VTISRQFLQLHSISPTQLNNWPHEIQRMPHNFPSSPFRTMDKRLLLIAAIIPPIGSKSD